MSTAVFFTSLFFSLNVLVHSKSSEEKIGELAEHKSGELPDQISEPDAPDYSYDTTMRFPKGIVPYYIETISYDSIIVGRIQAAMDLVEASSCVVFRQLPLKPATSNGSWVHFANPEEKRECVHGPDFGLNGEILIIIGYECMMFRYILHAVLHSIGFKDEVSHPHRDQYIRIIWENIQPKYRPLFRIQHEDPQYKVVEYDPMSIMHFHDRAFSSNGAPTIASRLPGLRIKPSEKLSQLDVMKLRLWFGHECNKRKVGALLEKCKTVFHNSPANQISIKNEDEMINENEADKDVDPYAANIYDMGMGQWHENDEAMNGDTDPYYSGGVGGYGEGGDEGMNGGDGDMDGGNRTIDQGNGAINGGNGTIDGGNGAIDSGYGDMDGGDGGMDGSDGGMDGGGGMDGNDGGMDGGDGNDDGGDLEDVGDDDANAVEDDGVRRKINHK